MLASGANRTASSLPTTSAGPTVVNPLFTAAAAAAVALANANQQQFAQSHQLPSLFQPPLQLHYHHQQQQQQQQQQHPGHGAFPPLHSGAEFLLPTSSGRSLYISGLMKTFLALGEDLLFYCIQL
ncbi:unnamed protein product [Protopolystoma xenopodis]|uniref:Uncharacterized protein n=1 Tax=Protopolystoma xenopodis TaxID=117903 RepID=A0A3S5CJR4_9PLAT|nr:unnamed protein product [Protopolystoma xenopodis]